MSMKKRAVKESRSISHSFKITMVILLFVLTSIRLGMVSYFPESEIISDKVLLFVILFIVAYLWMQELKDYHNLRILNKNLEEAHEHLKQAEIDTISSLIQTEEEKDHYTHGHSERVTRIAVAIAGEMGLGKEEKRIVERSGMLHDIGKIGIGDAILGKPGKLTEDEWNIIKEHPGKADKILEPLKFLLIEREIILSHHERYDGKGYPRGLKGNEIRREALILAVSDAFDAMNSQRSYRAPLSKDAIIAELTKGRGTQHSPEVVDAIFRLLEKNVNFWQR